MSDKEENRKLNSNTESESNSKENDEPKSQNETEVGNASNPISKVNSKYYLHDFDCKPFFREHKS